MQDSHTNAAEQRELARKLMAELDRPDSSEAEAAAIGFRLARLVLAREDSLSTTRPVDESYASWLKSVRAIVELATRGDDPDEVSQATLDTLGIEREDVDQDAAYEHVEGMIYDVTERGKRTLDVTGDRSWTVESIELLLGGGGPTVTATFHVDEDYGVERITYWHSWGSAVGQEATHESDDPDELSAAGTLLQLLGVADA